MSKSKSIIISVLVVMNWCIDSVIGGVSSSCFRVEMGVCWCVFLEGCVFFGLIVSRLGFY